MDGIRTLAEWKRLYFLVPANIKPLVELCFEFVKYKDFLESASPYYTSSNLTKLTILFERIVNKYIEIIEGGEESDVKKKEKIKEDLFVHFSSFIDEQGRVKDISSVYTVQLLKDNLTTYLPVFVAPMESFIYAKIFDVLRESHLKLEQDLTSEFVKLNLQRSGIHPKQKEEKHSFYAGRDPGEDKS